MTGNESGTTKHHAWVELYFDLVFVFAVGQLTHLIIDEPRWKSVAVALGLFLTLWWTWIGFVVLYNRHGEDRPGERLFLLVGTVPCAIAAVEAHDALEGHLIGFGLALAGARLVLAVAYPVSSGEGRRIGLRAGWGYTLSAALFLVSAALSGPWRYLLWALALVLEASFLLLAEARGAHRYDRGALGDRAGAVNAGHLADRFNLFMIIMFGEVVISVCTAATAVSTRDSAYWLGLAAGLTLTGALWWIYFGSAAHINEYLLRTSGGNPALAYGIYAGGYVLPTFALIVIAAGCGLALEEAPPAAAVWMVTIGLAGYLAGVRVFESDKWDRRRYLAQGLLIAVTVSVALLNRLLVGAIVVAAAAVWAVAVAVATSWRPAALHPTR